MNTIFIWELTQILMGIPIGSILGHPITEKVESNSTFVISQSVNLYIRRVWNRMCFQRNQNKLILVSRLKWWDILKMRRIPNYSYFLLHFSLSTLMMRFILPHSLLTHIRDWLRKSVICGKNIKDFSINSKSLAV